MSLLAVLLVLGCGESSGPSGPSGPSSTPSSGQTPPPVDPTPQYNAGPLLVSLPTYDGSGEAVHPDIAFTPIGWSAAATHVVATPYPAGNSHFENPSYFDVTGAAAWLTPAGAPNPLAMPSGSGYLSDPDIVYDPDSRTMLVYYREVTDRNRIYVIRSEDGVHWSDPVTVLEVPNHLAVSPSVVRRGAGDWLMWTVNAGDAGCSAPTTTVELRHSRDGLAWSPPEEVRIGRNGEYPWHIDVEWIPSRHEYWAVYNAKTRGSCMTEIVRFATSQDGVSFTEFPSPLLRVGVIPEFSDVVYRSSIAYDAASNVVTALYSGARVTDGRYAWHVATEQLDLRALMARVTTAQPSLPAHMRMPDTRVVPELTNETAP